MIAMCETTIRGKVRETRLGKKVGFADVEAPGGFRGPTDEENEAMDAIREACENIDADEYEAGDVVAEITVSCDGESEITYFDARSES